MPTIQEVTEKILQFRKERDWEQFHTPKNLAISLSLEAAEVLEHFQWKSEAEIVEYIKTNKKHVAEELADVLNYLLLMAHDFDIDLLKACEEKIEANAKKYPIEKAKGKHIKYDKL
jgi:NTP pyrophosphatase (non-canonical NTP hydrolase)